jgi:hypothetical protein
MQEAPLLLKKISGFLKKRQKNREKAQKAFSLFKTKII